MGVATSQRVEVAPRVAGADAASLAPTDLAEILARFNDASVALQRTHETLQGEVTRLTRELEEANEQLQRSRRLAALGEMAAGIAHEVRNPLASIGLDARMIEAEAPENAEARAAAERIGVAVRGLDRVVGDVLCFARELRPRIEAVPAAEVLERAECECGPLACAAGVSIERDASGALQVRCDADLAHRALTNLVRNAIEAIAESGASERRIVLSARGVASGGRGACVLAVRDSGPGIAPGVTDRMFNPFFTTRAAGTGLGLAIVHRIMDAHAGRVEARNNWDGLHAGQGGAAGGSGATFELVFPERRAPGRRPALEKDR